MNLFIFLLTFFVINNVYFQLTSGMFKIPREGGYHQDESTDRKGKGIVQTEKQQMPDSFGFLLTNGMFGHEGNQYGHQNIEGSSNSKGKGKVQTENNNQHQQMSTMPNNNGVEFSLTELSILIRILLKFKEGIILNNPNLDLYQLMTYFIFTNLHQFEPYINMSNKLIHVINYYKTKFDEAEKVCKIKKQEILKGLETIPKESVEFKNQLIEHSILKEVNPNTKAVLIYRKATRIVKNMNAKQLDFTYVSMELNSFLNSDRNAYIVWNLILFTRKLIILFIYNYKNWTAFGQHVPPILNGIPIENYENATSILSGIALKWGEIMNKSTYSDILGEMFPPKFNIIIDIENNYLINYIWLINITDAIIEYYQNGAQAGQSSSHQGGHEGEN
uniref:Uncharacterized protein n=1 Tax=Meloidogyne hapla TaxID=6305 RepID=A0A1I8BTZ8_MELHA